MVLAAVVSKRLTVRRMHADGTVVCYGQGCSVTFHGTPFKRCTLVVAAGAHAALHSCTFSNDTSKCDGLGVLASGAGTSVTMHVRHLSPPRFEFLDF